MNANEKPITVSTPSGGSAAGVKYPKGVCIVCGSVLLIQYWRGHIGNQRIHCNDCGSEVTPLMHAKKQPNAPAEPSGNCDVKKSGA